MSPNKMLYVEAAHYTCDRVPGYHGDGFRSPSAEPASSSVLLAQMKSFLCSCEKSENDINNVAPQREYMGVLTPSIA